MPSFLCGFNVPGYDCVNGFPRVNSHYCTKVRDIIHGATCYLGRQHNFTLNSMNLHLVFENFMTSPLPFSILNWLLLILTILLCALTDLHIIAFLCALPVLFL